MRHHSVRGSPSWVCWVCFIFNDRSMLAIITRAKMMILLSGTVVQAPNLQVLLVIILYYMTSSQPGYMISRLQKTKRIKSIK